MTPKELRIYVLTNRDDEKAIHLYIDKLHTDPDIVRYRGDFGEEGGKHLEALLERRTRGTQVS